MKYIILFKQWDIVLVRFPFTNYFSSKQRPALIVSPVKYNITGDYIIVYITSNIHSFNKYGDYLLQDWQESGLPKPSLIRMKYATIESQIIIKKIGSLTDFDIENLKSSIINFFS
jgi:mRNA interferase MazF